MDERIRLFQPKPNVDDDKLLGSHAKILVTDGQHAYIGSANLTHPGLIVNLEMGILVHGNIAAQAASFLEYLIDIEFLVQIPILSLLKCLGSVIHSIKKIDRYP